jgi:hypothetical protein
MKVGPTDPLLAQHEPMPEARFLERDRASLEAPWKRSRSSQTGQLEPPQPDTSGRETLRRHAACLGRPDLERDVVLLSDWAIHGVSPEVVRELHVFARLMRAPIVENRPNQANLDAGQAVFLDLLKHFAFDL